MTIPAKGCYNGYIIEKREVNMSNLHNEKALEYYYEQGLEMGMTEEEAEEYAYEKFDGGQ